MPTVAGELLVVDGMMEQWVIGPPNIGLFPNVKWDFTRRVAFRTFKTTATGTVIDGESSVSHQI